MPELPEVEVVRRSLETFIKGLKIKKVSIFNRNLRYKISKSLSRNIKDQKIIFIKRRSKFLLLGLAGGKTILIHLGMTGKTFITTKKPKKTFKTSFYYKNEIIQKHNHIKIEFNKSINLIYNDVRKFGFIKLISTNETEKNKHLLNLGPEPLSDDFNSKYLSNKVLSTKKNVKSLLMDQKILSGLGNIYVNEILYLSAINPKRISKRLKIDEIKRIVKNTKTILIKAIDFGGSSIRDFQTTSGKSGKFQQKFMVYDRHNQPCKKTSCSSKIKKFYISNSSTFCCLKCQK